MHKKTKAFTLIELVVTLGVSAILLAMTSAVFVYYSNFYQKQRQTNALLAESYTFKNRINSIIGSASSFSLFQVGSSTPLFSTTDYNNKPTNYYFENRLLMAETTTICTFTDDVDIAAAALDENLDSLQLDFSKMAYASFTISKKQVAVFSFFIAVRKF